MSAFNKSLIATPEYPIQFEIGRTMAIRYRKILRNLNMTTKYTLPVPKDWKAGKVYHFPWGQVEGQSLVINPIGDEHADSIVIRLNADFAKLVIDALEEVKVMMSIQGTNYTEGMFLTMAMAYVFCDRKKMLQEAKAAYRSMLLRHADCNYAYYGTKGTYLFYDKNDQLQEVKVQGVLILNAYGKRNYGHFYTVRIDGDVNLPGCRCAPVIIGMNYIPDTITDGMPAPYQVMSLTEADYHEYKMEG